MAAPIDVAFIVVGGPKLLPKARQAATHLNATSSLPVRIHLVSDKPLPRQPWFELHLLSAMPAAADVLHRNLSKLGVGPSFIYMWKPFLYQLLPLDRVLVLDFDVLVLGDLRELWEQFDAFAPSSLLGLAHSQSPEYDSLGSWPHKPGPRAGLNGGVQLQHLQRMRADAAAGGMYLRDLQRCAAGGCKRYWKLPRLGDQTYYTGLCLREPSLCHVLPCEWNRQLSNRFFGHADFRPWHECGPPCKMAHGNQPLLEGLIFDLQRQGRRPSCAECRRGYEGLKAKWINATTRNPRWRWGVDKEWMSAVVLRGCCANATDAAEGAAAAAAALPAPLVEAPTAADEADATGPAALELARAARVAGRGGGLLRRNYSLARRFNHSLGGLGARRNHSWAHGHGWAERHPRRLQPNNVSRRASKQALGLVPAAKLASSKLAAMLQAVRGGGEKRSKSAGASRVAAAGARKTRTAESRPRTPVRD